MTQSQVEQLRRLPIQQLEVWQGAFIEIPVHVVGGGEGPICAAWCDVQSGLVHVGDIVVADDASPAQLWDCLVTFALRDKRSGHLPGRLEVALPDDVEYLRKRLEGIGVEVQLVKKLPGIEKVIDEMEDFLRKNPPPTEAQPDRSIMSGRGVTIREVRAFAEAAAAFFKAAPWKHFANDDLVEIESPKPPGGMKFVGVMGAGGQTTGLGFFANRKAFENMNKMAAKELLESSKHTLWSVQFDDADGTPPEDVALWSSMGLPLPAKNAYPFAAGFEPAGDSFIRPSAAQLRFMETLLLAFASSSESQIDSGRWKLNVAASGGTVEVALSLPGMHEPADKKKKPGRAVAPRAMMDLTAEIAALIAEFEPANAQEAERLVAQHLSEGVPAKLKGKGNVAKKTAQERAMALYYEAAQVRGRRQLQLIRQALAEDPDCAAAHVLMGERASDPATALKNFRLAHEAGLRTLGDRIERDAGHFWLMHDTRPFMRAKYGMAHALIYIGSIACLTEAAELLKQMLTLNPNDNQGARYLYPGVLMRLEKDADAARFMKEQSDEPSAQWTYLRALLAFRLGGDCEASRMELKRAVDANPYMVDLLRKSPAELPPSPAAYAPGSEEEALCCLDEIGLLIDDSPGASDWIATQGKAFVPAKRRK